MIVVLESTIGFMLHILPLYQHQVLVWLEEQRGIEPTCVICELLGFGTRLSVTFGSFSYI